VRASPDWWSWGVGFVSSLVVLGPAFKAGSLLNFDMVLPPRIPLPSGVWGLGPDVPRRMPLGVVLAWLSTLIGGRGAGLLLFLVCLTAAFAGAAHLARGCARPFRLLAGFLFAFNPFTLTRLVAGHWTVLAALAVLPWALPALLRPGDDLRRTFLWCAAFGVTGFVGGALAACLLGVGLVADRGRQFAGVALRWAVAQIPWVVPGIIVIAAGPHLASAAEFPTRGEGPLGPLGSVLAGHGFWQASVQVGGQATTGIVALGVVFLALAVHGMGQLPSTWAKRAAWAAAVGLLIAVASSTPGIRTIYNPLSSTPILEAFRESQKGLALYIAWLAPAAAFGVSRIAGQIPARRVIYAALALACALTLDGAGLSGLHNHLEPVEFPAGWRQARDVIQSNPGTTLAFPWHQYLSIHWARNRLMLNPLPDYLGGDVLSSSDPEFGQSRLERADPREPTVIHLLDDLTPDSLAPALQALNVRWVVLLHEVDWQAYSEMEDDPSLEALVRSPELTLYRVRTWVAPLLANGHPVTDHSVFRALHRTESSGPAVLAAPFASGWLRGLRPAHQTPAGLLSLPAGGTLVWYWPALLVGLADLGWIVLICRTSYAAARKGVIGPVPAATVERDERPVLYSEPVND
jgi:hypothetical protein